MKTYTFSEYVELIKKHQDEAKEMAERLARVKGYGPRAERMANCETYTKGLFCPRCKTFHTIKASLCRDRLCPNCGWALARRRASALLQTIDELSKQETIEVLHIVLTLKHDERSRLKDQIDAILSAFYRLMRKKRMREYLIGYERSLEIKKGKNGFHPHIHLLMIVKKEYLRHMITNRELSTLWREAAAVEYNPVVWIKKAYGKKAEENELHDAIYECVKYTIKTNEWKTMNDRELEEAASAIYGRQLFKVNGEKVNEIYKRVFNEREEILETPFCKKCGSKRTIAVIGGKA